MCWEPYVLLPNMKSLETKLNELGSRLSCQRDIKNCNILCFSESWLTKDMDNIQLAGGVYASVSASGKIRGCGECFFVNSWCSITNKKEVSRLC